MTSFKQWLEGPTGAATSPGNQQFPQDAAGLYDAGGSTNRRPIPNSEKANKMFLGKKRMHKLRRRNKVATS